MWPALLLLAQGGLQLWSGYQQAELIEGQTDLQQDINDLNAQYVEYDAWEAERFGYTQAARYSGVVDSVVGSQRAGYAAEGVDVNFGTAAQVQEDSRLNAHLNALDIQKAARAKARGLRVEASNIRLQGELLGIEGDLTATSRETAGIFGFLGSGARAYQYADAYDYDMRYTRLLSAGGGTGSGTLEGYYGG